jgi:hypothetical protein
MGGNIGLCVRSDDDIYAFADTLVSLSQAARELLPSTAYHLPSSQHREGMRHRLHQKFWRDR